MCPRAEGERGRRSRGKKRGEKTEKRVIAKDVFTATNAVDQFPPMSVERELKGR